MSRQVALAGLLVGVAGVGACTTVRHVQATQYLEDNAPQVVWVTYANNTVVLVADPVIKRDTLRGMLQGGHDRVAIPLSEIQSVQAKVPDHMKTALLATTVGVAVFSSLYFGYISKAGSGKMNVDCFGDEVLKHPDEHPECF